MRIGKSSSMCFNREPLSPRKVHWPTCTTSRGSWKRNPDTVSLYCSIERRSFDLLSSFPTPPNRVGQETNFDSDHHPNLLGLKLPVYSNLPSESEARDGSCQITGSETIWGSLMGWLSAERNGNWLIFNAFCCSLNTLCLPYYFITYWFCMNTRNRGIPSLLSYSKKVSFNHHRALPDRERRERGMNSCKLDMEFLSYCNKECFIGVGGSS